MPVAAHDGVLGCGRWRSVGLGPGDGDHGHGQLGPLGQTSHHAVQLGRLLLVTIWDRAAFRASLSLNQ